MADEYIIVNSSQNIHYYDEKTFFEFLNEAVRQSRDGSGYSFLSKFPMPNSGTFVGGSRDMGRDSKGRPMGRFCPFGDSKSWPANALLVLKNGTIFVPEKIRVTKIVEEYGLPNTDATPAVKKVPKTTSTK